ncbi:MAG: PilN domain-containing protein [Xanthomonadaceae bacterium]|nr:PilN domain-containing protein [Xanthomonadaceae bacterium]
MIKINLAKKKSLQAQDNMTELREKTKTIIGLLERFKLAPKSGESSINTREPIIRLVACVVLCFFADSYVGEMQQKELDKLQIVLAKYQKEQKEAKAEVDKIKNFEPQKKLLEDNENILNTKLDLVEKLMLSRSQSLKMLYALSGALPQDVWIRSLKKNKDDIIIAGGALEFNYVSDFMKKLSENVNFGNVQPRFQKNERTGGGVQYVNFELMVRKAGSNGGR